MATTVAVAAGVVVVSVLAYTQLPLAMTRNPTPLAFAPDGYRWLQAFSWWDGAWYTGIADHGYTFSLGRPTQRPVVFFPASPLLARVLRPLAGNTVIAGFLVSLACGLGACVLFHRWCATPLGRTGARLALASLLLYPGSFYLFGTLYAGGMFLLLAVAAFLPLERDRPLAAGLAAALATATRPTGILLIAHLWVRALERRGGLGAPGRRRIDLSVLRPFRRFGLGYGVYAAGVVGLCAVSTKDFIGLARYVLVAFPCFAAAGAWLEERPRPSWWVLGLCGALLLFVTHWHARNMLIS